MDPSDYRVMGIGCDVSSELSVQQAFRRVMDTYGRVDSVVASAGASHALVPCTTPSPPLTTPPTPQASLKITPRSSTYPGAPPCSARPITDVTTYALLHAPFFRLPSYPFDRIKRLYDINVHGAFFTAREAARNMIPLGGGSIVLVASMSANVSAQPRTPRSDRRAG